MFSSQTSLSQLRKNRPVFPRRAALPYMPLHILLSAERLTTEATIDLVLARMVFHVAFHVGC
jgi:hypothetical protein